MTEPTKETPKKKDDEKSPSEQAAADTQSPEQKHKAYLARLDALHNEP